MVRVKNRYLLCEVHVSDRSLLLQLNDRAVSAAVKQAVARMHGDYGAALCSIRFKVIYLNAHTGIVFLRFPKKCYKLLWSALPFITSIETHGQTIPCFLNCLHVGGTIRTCQKFLIRHNTKQLHQMLPKCKNEKERRQVREAILACSPKWIKKEEEIKDEEQSDDEEEEEEEEEEE